LRGKCDVVVGGDGVDVVEGGEFARYTELQGEVVMEGVGGVGVGERSESCIFHKKHIWIVKSIVFVIVFVRHQFQEENSHNKKNDGEDE